MAKSHPPLEIRLRTLSALDYAPGNCLRERCKNVAQKTFTDPLTQTPFQFTWKTISTWYYRYKLHGLTSLEKKPRSDKNTYRKVQPAEIAEAIHEILPLLKPNKSGLIPKSVLYDMLIQKHFFTRSQLSPTSFYRIAKQNDLLSKEDEEKLRHSFSMKFANELWQADTMYGPSIKQPDGSWGKTFLIAFIDDASRVIAHGEFFYNDNTENMVRAFRAALFKRGRPERLYFDNGANYTSNEILQACLRLDIKLSHAPVRDGSAKGKIERFFRGFRDRFLTKHPSFESLNELNEKTQRWIEEDYNARHHCGIGMIPLDRFNLDRHRIHFLTDDEYTEEVFFVEQERKVSKTNVFSIHASKYECPVDLRQKVVQVRFDRTRKNRYLVYFKGQRMGQAIPLDLHFNAHRNRNHHP